MNKKLTAIGAVVLSCSLLFGCGRGSDKHRDVPADSSESEGSTTTSSFGGGSNSSSSGNSEESKFNGKKSMPSSTVDSELSEAESFLEADMIDDAREMLGYVDRDSLTDEQKEQYDQISEKLEEASTEEEPFTPQQAVEIVEQAYGINFRGEMSGIHSQTDSDGKEYYRLQIEVPSQNARKTVDVYQDRRIIEISSEVLAFG